MEIKRENKPFILSKSNKPTLLPSDYRNFDERIESFIRYVQGANTFVAVLHFKKKQNVVGWAFFLDRTSIPDNPNPLLPFRIFRRMPNLFLDAYSLDGA